MSRDEASETRIAREYFEDGLRAREQRRTRDEALREAVKAVFMFADCTARAVQGLTADRNKMEWLDEERADAHKKVAALRSEEPEEAPAQRVCNDCGGSHPSDRPCGPDTDELANMAAPAAARPEDEGDAETFDSPNWNPVDYVKRKKAAAGNVEGDPLAKWASTMAMLRGVANGQFNGSPAYHRSNAAEAGALIEDLSAQLREARDEIEEWQRIAVAAGEERDEYQAQRDALSTAVGQANADWRAMKAERDALAKKLAGIRGDLVKMSSQCPQCWCQTCQDLRTLARLNEKENTE